MRLTPDQISSTEIIGYIDRRPVYHIVTKGGYNVVTSQKEGDDETAYLGLGPHSGVATFIAKKRAPKLRLLRFEKSSDGIDPNGAMVRRYEAYLDLLIAASKVR